MEQLEVLTGKKHSGGGMLAKLNSYSVVVNLIVAVLGVVVAVWFWIGSTSRAEASRSTELVQVKLDTLAESVQDMKVDVKEIRGKVQALEIGLAAQRKP